MEAILSTNMRRGVLRGGFRRKVRADVFIPQPQSGKDMAGHMKRMRSGRSDGSVTSGCFQSLLRHHWVIAGMDDVVRNAWMVWMLPENRIKNCHGLLGVDESYIVTRVRIDQGKRIEDLRFQVIRIVSGNFFHRVGISLGVHIKVLFCVTIEEKMHCVKVSHFSWILLSRLVCHAECSLCCDYTGTGWPTVDLVEIGHRHAPVRHRAVWIRGRNISKCLFCL